MSDKSKQLSFVADEDTIALIDDLKKELKVRTSAGVFRKVLALAKVAVDQAKESDGVVTVRGRSQGSDKEVSVALRA